MTITVTWANSTKSFTSLDAAHTFRRWIESAYPALRGSVSVKGSSKPESQGANARRAIERYALTAAEAATVTSAQLSETAFWVDAHCSARHLPEARKFLLDLIARDWRPWGSNERDACNQIGS